MHKLKVIFMGTPAFSVPVFEKLCDSFNVVLVVTRPDAYVGRDRKLTFSPIKAAALKRNIDVIEPVKLSEVVEVISEINPDFIVTCAYGKIVPESILNIPKYGCINVHASLLPKYRGASPIQSAIINGEKETGITIMYMDKTLDTGDIVCQEKVVIDKDDNYLTLSNKLSETGSNLLISALNDIVLGKSKRVKQDDKLATYTHLIKREDEKIDFSLSGNEILNKIRAFSPNPFVNFSLNNKEYKIVKAYFEKKENIIVNKVYVSKDKMGIGCKDGIVFIEEIKPVGKNIMNIKAFINGIKNNGELYVN